MDFHAKSREGSRAFCTVPAGEGKLDSAAAWQPPPSVKFGAKGAVCRLHAPRGSKPGRARSQLSERALGWAREDLAVPLAFPEPHRLFAGLAYRTGKVAPRVKAAAAETLAPARSPATNGDSTHRYDLPRTLRLRANAALTQQSQRNCRQLQLRANSSLEALELGARRERDLPTRILIADDASTDMSAEVIAFFERAHPGRFRVLRNQHKHGND